MDKKIPRIGLVMKSLQAEFFQNMLEGAKKFAGEHGGFELVPVGTDSQTEIEAQIGLVDQLIAEGVDGLVVVPIDSKALVPVVVKAVRAGIKVVNIDIRLDEELLKAEGVDLVYVGPDNEGASKAVGDVLTACLLPGSGVLMLEGLSVAENAQQRKAGFLRSIDEAGMVLLESEPADWETDRAEMVFRKLWEQHPDAKGVMCCNDAMALGVLRVLKAFGLAGQIPVVGFDNDASVQEPLRNGQMLATIDAYGSQMAVEGIRYVLKMLTGSSIKGHFATPYSLINFVD